MNGILITGANGFVGRALCNALRGRDISFVPAVRRVAERGQIEVGELSAQTRWDEALSGCDVVIHLAARVHMMQENAADPLAAYLTVNRDATLNLARQAAQAGVRRFVFVSSVKVNGEHTVLGRPFSASDIPHPQDAYGQSKLEAETGLAELARETGLEVAIVRPPLVYGPGVGANFLRLMKLVRQGMPLPLGAVENRRSMVALDNLIDLLILCAHHSAAAGQTFLVSDGQDVSTPELIRMLASSMGRRATLLPVPEKVLAGAAAMLGKRTAAERLLGSLQVEISHIRTTLGWEPRISMREAIDATVAHFVSRP